MDYSKSESWWSSLGNKEKDRMQRECGLNKNYASLSSPEIYHLWYHFVASDTEIIEEVFGKRESFQSLYNSPKSWSEDYHLENGNYMNTCSLCKETFMGYKRRVVCKECANPELPSK